MSNDLMAKQEKNLGVMLKTDAVKSRFNEVLGKKAPTFISSLLSLANNSELLSKADPQTILTAGMACATMDLPVNQNLGYAYIVPFYDSKSKRYVAQFLMGYKGYIQLAMRSGQYQRIEAKKVYEGELLNINTFTGEFETGEKISDKVVGYWAYFKLVNGFEKYLYMTVEEMQAHASKFSKNYKGGTDRWGIADFDSMAIKTVLRRLLSKYGILSIEMRGMETALACDGAVVQDDNGTLLPTFDNEVDDNTTTIDIDVSDSADAVTAEADASLEDELKKAGF